MKVVKLSNAFWTFVFLYISSCHCFVTPKNTSAATFQRIKQQPSRINDENNNYKEVIHKINSVISTNANSKQLDHNSRRRPVSPLRDEETPQIVEHFESLPSFRERTRNSADATPPNPDFIVALDQEQLFAYNKPADNEYYIWRAPFASNGHLWPKPRRLTLQSQQFYRLFIGGGGGGASIPKFHTSANCQIATFAIARLQHQISRGRINYAAVEPPAQSELFAQLKAASAASSPGHSSRSDSAEFSASSRLISSLPILNSVNVFMKACGSDWPSESMNEQYSLKFQTDSVRIDAEEQWGALRAIHSLSQLLFKLNNSTILVRVAEIEDSPAFSHRGLMVDTSRHFIPKHVLLENIDAMEMNKLNVFHWHIVDDQSFPFESRRFPELWRRGAFQSHQTYSFEAIREIVEYARVRGVRVVPEFDMPGHAYSWGRGHPEILAQCSGRWLGSMNPVARETFHVIHGLYAEALSLFPDSHFHMGQDEVGTGCWQSDEKIQNILSRKQLTSDSQILNFFFQKVHNILQKLARQMNFKGGKTPIVWQEAYDKEIKLPRDTVVQVWKSTYAEVPAALQQSSSPQKFIFSKEWYLDRIPYGPTWSTFYQANFYEGDDPRVDKPTLLGGEACMWNEYQSSDTVLKQIWPAASSVAERLWTGKKDEISAAGSRIEEQRCRMLLNGIKVNVAGGSRECKYVPEQRFSYQKPDTSSILQTYGSILFTICNIVVLLIGIRIGRSLSNLRFSMSVFRQKYFLIFIAICGSLYLINLFLFQIKSH